MYWSIAISVSIAIIASLFVAFKSRRALRGLWADHERLKESFRQIKEDLLDLQRKTFGETAGLFLKRNLPISFHGQHCEDILLWNFFDRKESGFYVDIGAFDGVSLSNSYAFEQIGWQGIFVEANPQVFEACQKSRPNSSVIHAAVGAPTDNDYISFYQVSGPGGVATLSFVEADKKHLERCRQEGGAITEVKVPYRSLDDILAEHCHDHYIDFVSIDVEGGELAVLQGFDLQRYKPMVIVAENNSSLPGKGKDVANYLILAGYELRHNVGCNEFYVRRGETRQFLEQ